MRSLSCSAAISAVLLALPACSLDTGNAPTPAGTQAKWEAGAAGAPHQPIGGPSSFAHVAIRDGEKIAHAFMWCSDKSVHLQIQLYGATFPTVPIYKPEAIKWVHGVYLTARRNNGSTNFFLAEKSVSQGNVYNALMPEWYRGAVGERLETDFSDGKKLSLPIDGTFSDMSARCS